MYTTTQEYVDAVMRGEWPSNQPGVPLASAFTDPRGEIFNLLLGEISSVGLIRSKRGAVRANHLHKTDWHFTYVANGSVLYFERSAGAPDIPTPTEFRALSMFFTPPGVEHAMLFTQDTDILTFARNIRSHDNHEADLVRVEFITPKIVERYVSMPR